MKSRATRAARGVGGAIVITLLAAVSHSFAGGMASIGTVICAAILTSPLCVLLAGRLASAWRLTLAVGVSQLFYHWLFVNFTLTPATFFAPLHTHTHHFAGGMLHGGAAGNLAAHASHADSPLMWLLHALAAVCTVLILLHGDRAVLRLGEQLAAVAFTLWRIPARAFQLPGVSIRPRQIFRQPFALQIFASARITHRGPPVPAL